MANIAPPITKRIGKTPKKPVPKRSPGAERRVGHRWRKGESGNPGGRPAAVREIRDLAQAEGYNCIQTLIMIRDNPEFPPITRLAAANSLLDRGFGRPMTSVAIAQLPPPVAPGHVTKEMSVAEAQRIYEATLRVGQFDDSGADNPLLPKPVIDVDAAPNPPDEEEPEGS
jgi:hypothetical protein